MKERYLVPLGERPVLRDCGGACSKSHRLAIVQSDQRFEELDTAEECASLLMVRQSMCKRHRARFDHVSAAYGVHGMRASA
jgi:hypothetical protein